MPSGSYTLDHPDRILAIYGYRPCLSEGSGLTMSHFHPLSTYPPAQTPLFHSLRSQMAQDAVPLPKRSKGKITCCSPSGCAGSACPNPQGGTELEPRSSNLWPIESRIDAEPICEAATLLREKCCKHDTKPERQLVSGDMVRDM